jgi:hypothetical protein
MEIDGKDNFESIDKMYDRDLPPEKVMEVINLTPGMKIGEEGVNYGYFTFRMSKCAGNDTTFLNPAKIIISSKTIVEPSREEFEWGIRLLKELNLEDLDCFEKAQIIQRYVSENFKYRIRSPRIINDIIKIKGGNCISHTIMGLFLLRLSGIPAKLCYEFHVKNSFIIDQWRANSQKAAYFGRCHNSHYWILFFDGSEWKPFDSALGIIGYEEFFTVRTKTQRRPYFLSFNPKRMTGAPFIVQKETGTGTTNLVNITEDLWSRNFIWNNIKVTKEEWLGFVKSFKGKNTQDFSYPIDNQTKNIIIKMSKKWF